jgi:hypothetical protein
MAETDSSNRFEPQNRCAALPNCEIMPEDNGAKRAEMPNLGLLLKGNQWRDQPGKRLLNT